MQKHIDVIVPAKNEANNVSLLVKRLHQALTSQKISYQIIFINDYSTDNTKLVVKKLALKYPIKVFDKKGKPGKAYAILEGLEYSKAKYVAMIDADLQYPPEAIPQMLKSLNKYGLVIGTRAKNQESLIRKIFHNSYNLFFNKFLHGLDFDVQSGLKVFKREIFSHLDTTKVTPWTLDLSLLLTAKSLGFKIGEVHITFDKRFTGRSNINLVKTSFEIGINALKLKFNKKTAFVISSHNKNNMVGAGFIYKEKRFITHSTLDPKISAIQTFHNLQIFAMFFLVFNLILGFLLNPWVTGIVVIGILTLIYFLDVLFNFFVVLKSMNKPPELRFSRNQLKNIEEKNLPIFSILCPLYKEANMLPHFFSSIEKLDWPKNKLDVLLLLEEDDIETVRAARGMRLPKYVRILVVPDSQPKTKPKACNFGLNFVKGEYLVIYDAEDIPEPQQLKKAYLGFKRLPKNVACLQGKLNYYNSTQNLLTRFFTAEYSLWFDVILPGLQSVNTVIPLGGTSNIFKTKILKELKGWDPFNVTEDCDLGVRLFKEGYKTSIIDSTTLEEANSDYKNWLRQRSRWIKGYLQTFFVHNREIWQFIKTHKTQAFIFELIIGLRISFMLINPFLWVLTASYFLFFAYVGPTIESLFPPVIFYMAVLSLIFGNFVYLYNYMIGCAKKEHWHLLKYVFLMPVYWFMASISAYIAFYQLLVKPHYWEKTIHGLHLQKNKSRRFVLPRLSFQPFLAPFKYVANLIF